jgi:cytochrome c biogenesis protein CcdA/thiol-disulfide isomerase/thioredoxin
MLLLLISFIAGILTIFAPCVLPLLPVIVGGSVSAQSKDRLRPYLIAISLAASIILLTLLLKVSTLLIGLSPNFLNYLSGSLLITLGIVSVVPELWERLMIKLNWEAASLRLFGKSQKNKSRYIGPILIGVALGPVFASCSPTYAFILASVLPHSFASGLIYLTAYSFGLVITLLGISLVGKRLISRFGWALDTHGWFRRAIGVLFIATGLIILLGQEIPLETWVANHLPFDETRIERILLANQTGGSLIHVDASSDTSVLNVEPTPAPEFQGLTSWINSPPLTVASLRGKVVLVDFWTYSCINCIRSIPYVEKWYQTYAPKGLVVVGVNTPEFAFEHNPTNVSAAVIHDHISYPVALDNNYDTWNAYNNSSWPADYLIDKTGQIRYVSLGEGDYGTTEKAIQALLGINQPLTTPTSNVPISQSQSPETYFGTNRSQNFVGSPSEADGTTTYTPASSLYTNQWTLNGSWDVEPEYITSQSDSSKIVFNASAKDIYVVASSANNQPEPVSVSLSKANAGQYGIDANDGTAIISGSRLYHIVSLHHAGNATVTLTVPKGVSLYTFTFGS